MDIPERSDTIGLDGRQASAVAMPDRLDCANLYAILCERAAAGAVFVDWTAERYSYQSLVDDVHKCCALFSSRGLSPGQFVLIQTANEKVAISNFAAALLDGLVPVMLAPNTAEPRLRAIAELTKPALIIIDKSACDGRQWLAVHGVVAIMGNDRHANGPLDRWRVLLGAKESFADIDYRSGHRPPRCRSGPDDLAYILFTSGTTSAPKGVMATHRNIFAHLATLSRVLAYDHRSAIFNGLVLAHADGLVQGPLLAMANGCRVVRPPAFSMGALEQHLSLIREKRATHFVTVPTLYRFIDRYAQRDDYFDGAEFTTFISVAAKLDEQLWRRLQNRFRRPVYNIYGLTETVSGALYAGPREELGAIGTIGKPIDIDIRLVRSDGTAPPDDEPGEIWLRGDNVSPGYFGNPTATAEKYAGPWLKTGDLAIRRAEASYEIAGRINAVIMSGGFLINPDEVDEALMSHPAVAEAVTIGMPDPDFGEIAVSAVVLDGVADELIFTEHCSRLLEPKKVPKRVLVVSSIPRGDAGKPRLEQLRSIIAAHIDSTPPNATDSPMAETVISAASHVFRMPVAKLSLDGTPQTIARWDSFAHIVLILEAERRTGRHIPASVAINIDSLRKLVDALEQPGGPTEPEFDPPPYGVFIGTSLAQNALPSGHPASDIFVTAGTNERIITIAFANQSETQIMTRVRRAVDAGVRRIFIELNPFLLTYKFERIALANATRFGLLCDRFALYVSRLRTMVLTWLGMGAYAQDLLQFKIYYPATIRAPRDPTAIATALKIARQQALTVVWVAMPRSQRAADYLGSRFEAKFERQLRAFAADFGAEVWRPARSWPNEYFIDNAHCNEEGRAHFLDAMRRYVATNRTTAA